MQYFDDLYTDITKKRNIYNRALNKFFITLIVLFFIFSLIAFTPKIPTELRWLGYLIVILIMVFTLPKFWSNVRKSQLDSSDRIMRILIAFVKKYEKYAHDPINNIEKNESKKHFNTLIYLIKESLRSYNNLYTFDQQGKYFLIELKDYLNFKVKYSFHNPDDKNRHIVYDLEDVIKHMKKREFSAAEEFLRKKKGEITPTSFQKIFSYFNTTSNVSNILTIIILGGILIYFNQRYNLLESLQGFNTLLNFLSILITIAAFRGVSQIIKKVLDLLLSIEGEKIPKN